MKKDFKRPNGTTKRVQYVEAPRKGISSMGSRFKKGDAIVHLSSSRCTGETFVLLPTDILNVLGLGGSPNGLARSMARPGKWASPKKWGEVLAQQWHEDQCWLVKVHGGPCPISQPESASY